MSQIVVGIDLGTTNTCVSVFLDNKVKILENKEGGRITPSFVYLTDPKVTIVGQFAKRMSHAKPEYGIYEIKRLIGRKYDDPYVQKNLEYLPFQVKNIDNEPVIIIEHKSEMIKKRPTDLCASILKKIKTDVEAKLSLPIDKAVITVPAYFNISQREVTLEAARLAGLNVLKLLNEPTAAALTYYYDKKSNSDERTYSLVYDLGGGTFDVAILKRLECDIEIIGVDGDSHLGGHDFDNILVEYTCQELLTKYNFNPKNDRRLMRRLNTECEEAKKILSVVDQATIILNAFIPTISTVEISITREKFEKLANRFFTETIEIVDRCLKKAKLTQNDITEIIMSGGSTRIPKIQSMLSDYFNSRSLCKFVNPDECVAEGAALQAAMLSNDPQQTITQIKITDITALSLGISNFVDIMTFLIHRNTPIPTTGTTKRITVYNNQTNMTFNIYEGERLDAKKNYLLGCLEITDLTPAPPGQCSVLVRMSIDQNGILTISATESVSNKTKNLKIVYTRGVRNDYEVKNTVVDARENQAEDLRFKNFAELKGYALKYCIRAIYNFEKKGLVESYRKVYDKCVDTGKLLKHLDLDNEKEVIKLKNEIVTACDAIQKKHQFDHMP